ncbi:hypothetical protein VE02_03159 [Pseudogymnoascus sp. 03VT05]|nr:hypothetical protein VE02_03159 [Pseudogymnoascus sp. 03VT05]
MSSTQKIPIWLDCDPGHDDSFAILLAAHHPAAELLGLSTVHGNAALDNTTVNAGSVLTAIGKPDIPVYRGASKPLVRPAVHADAIHGESGLAGTDLLPTPARPADLSVEAVDAMAKAILATPPNTCWLVATGTLTNVAGLVMKYPAVVGHLKGLSIMGGAIGGGFTAAPMGKVGSTERYGNWTPYAEFNIVVDPEAAATIFDLPELAAKTTLIPLDVSHQVLANKDVIKLLHYGKKTDSSSNSTKPSALRTMLVELLCFFAETYDKVFGLSEGPPLHDPIAVAAMFEGTEYAIPLYDHEEGQQGRRERFNVKVITEGTHAEALNGKTETGRTIATLLPPGQEGVKIPRSLDVRNFWNVIEDCLEKADGVNATAKN